ncbi:MAG TPA: hypothetical protein G4N96_12700 [Chloroflexi bacterium]|nr:hypothetical protein [Chloroflexota bacterium]
MRTFSFSAIARYVKRNQWFIAIELAVLASITTLFMVGDNDLSFYYQPFARGCLECGYVPYFAYWFLWPLGLFSHKVTYFFLTAFSAGVLLAITYRRRANPLVVLLSFPAMALLWVSQIDAIIALGLGLAFGLFTKNNHWRGLGLVMAFIKPQISLLAVIVLLWQSPKKFLKMLPVPIIAAIASFIQFGLDWPLKWLQQAQSLPTHEYRQTAQMLFPYSLILLLTPFFIKNKDRQLQVALVASAFLPQYSIYSYVVFIVFLKPASWWIAPLSFLWLLFYPWLGEQSHIVQIVFPLIVLISLFIQSYSEQSAGRVAPK